MGVFPTLAWDPWHGSRVPPLNVSEKVITLPGYIKCIFYIQFMLIKILNLFQHIFMCQFSASQHFINHIQNKYQKYMTYIIKHLCVKFTHGHNFFQFKDIYSCQGLRIHQWLGKQKISPYPKVPSWMSSVIKGLRPLPLCCFGYLASKDMGLT